MSANTARQPTIERDQAGAIVCVRYTADEMLHREDGPAVIEFFPEGGRRSETWYLGGVIKRSGHRPSRMEYRLDGTASRAFWHQRNGLLHRKDGPALVTFAEDGQTPIEREWYRAGRPWCHECRSAVDRGCRCGGIA